MPKFHLIVGSDSTPTPLSVRKIGRPDLKYALAKGMEDFLTLPSSLLFLALIYPLAGIWLIVGNSPHLIFPLMSGFALIGPFAAIGLYEISRRREVKLDISWKDALGVMYSRSIFSILSLGLLLLIIFLSWQFTAHSLYVALFGRTPSETFAAFIGNVLSTPRGWIFIGLSIAAGFLYAVLQQFPIRMGCILRRRNSFGIHGAGRYRERS